VGGREGEGVGVVGDLLEVRGEEDLLGGVAGQAAAEGNCDGAGDRNGEEKKGKERRGKERKRKGCDCVVLCCVRGCEVFILS